MKIAGKRRRTLGGLPGALFSFLSDWRW